MQRFTGCEVAMDFFGDNYVRGFITDDNGQLWNTGTKEELDKWEQDNRDKARIYYDENDDVGHPLSWQFPAHPNIDYEDLAAKPDSMYEMPYVNFDVPVYKFKSPFNNEDVYFVRDTVDMSDSVNVDPTSLVAWNGTQQLYPETVTSVIPTLKDIASTLLEEIEENKAGDDIEKKKLELKKVEDLLWTLSDFAAILDYDITGNGLISPAGKADVEGTRSIYPDVDRIHDAINSKRQGNILNGISNGGTDYVGNE